MNHEGAPGDDDDEDDRPWFAYGAPAVPHVPYVAEHSVTPPAAGAGAGTFQSNIDDKPPYVRANRAAIDQRLCPMP